MKKKYRGGRNKKEQILRKITHVEDIHVADAGCGGDGR